jgi:hypothetical protein
MIKAPLLISLSILVSAASAINSIKTLEIGLCLFSPFCIKSVNSQPAYTLTCEDPTSCSPSVGAFFSDTKCTTYVVGSDLVVTSKHCLPANTEPGDDCSSDTLLFPAVGPYPEERAQCLKVVDASLLTSEQAIALDYVVLQTTENLHRPVLPISGRGVPDQMELHSYHFVSTTPHSGQIQSRTCRPVMRSMAYSLYQSPQSAVVGLPNCSTDEGNSGGPLLDASGAVRAMYNAHFHDVVIYLNGAIRPLESAYATNMACVSSQALGLTPQSTECEETFWLEDHYRHANETVRAMLGSLSTQIQIKHRFDNWQRNRSRSPLGWDVSFIGTADNVLHGVSRPTCIHAPYFGRRFDVEGFEISTILGLDDQFRYTIAGYREDFLLLNVRVDYQGHLTVNSTTSKLIEWSYDLPVCSR